MLLSAQMNKPDWNTFDELPEAVRDALRNAEYDWPADIIKAYMERGYDTADLLELIAALDRRERPKLPAADGLSSA
jgi:hypothetical protein